MDRLNGNDGPVIVDVERDREIVEDTGLDAICSGPAADLGTFTTLVMPSGSTPD